MVHCLGKFSALIVRKLDSHLVAHNHLYVTPALWNLTPFWRPLQAPAQTCTYTHTHTHKSLGAEEMAKQLKAHTVALGEHWNSATSTHIKRFPKASIPAPGQSVPPQHLWTPALDMHTPHRQKHRHSFKECVYTKQTCLTASQS